MQQHFLSPEICSFICFFFLVKNFQLEKQHFVRDKTTSLRQGFLNVNVLRRYYIFLFTFHNMRKSKKLHQKKLHI